jgi:ABC-type nitrate/sulfonate/bicarbonate transport system substrate-binding protein
MKKGTVVFAAVIVLAIVAGVFFLSAKKQPISKDVVIKVSDSSTTPDDWDIVFKLTGRDILKEEGVKLKRIPGTSGNTPPFQALLTGQYDVESRAWVGWPNVIARGAKIRAVFSPGTVTKELIGRSGVLVLETSGIKTVKDLKGKTIAINVFGLAAEYTIKLLLEKNGISPDQVQLVQVPIENEEQALRTKQVDAAVGSMNGGTWFDLAMERGGVFIIPGTGPYEINGQDSSWMGTGFRQDFISLHPEAVRRYVAAVIKAKQIIWDYFKKNPEHVWEVYAEIAREKGGNPKLAKYYLPLPPETTLIKDPDIQYWINVLVSVGQLKKGQIRPVDVYTNEFNPFYKKNAG